jgi:CBS domain-containing protein
MVAMNARELMSRDPKAVRTVDRLDAAARILWDHDCGFVPVVDAANVLVGVVTDRDLCMAVYTQGRSLGEIPVAVVMSRHLTTCRADDALSKVLEHMQRAQVHRLPVVDDRGALLGVLACNDLIRAAAAGRAGVDAKAVLATLAAIGAPRAVSPRKLAAGKTEPAAVVLAPAVPPTPAPAATKVNASATKVDAPAAKATAKPAAEGKAGARSSSRKRKS